MFERVRASLRGRRSVVVILATLALSGHLLARAATDYAAGKLSRAATAVPAGPVAGASEPLPGAAPPDARAILARNIFDPTPPAPPPDPRAADGPDRAARACDGSLRLVAAVVARDPKRSLATIAIGSAEPRLYRPGSRIKNQVLAKVMARSVQLRTGSGRLCTVRLFAEPLADGESFDETPEPLTALAAPALAESELDSAIKSEGGRFTMSRSFVERVLQRQAGAIAGVRAVLHQQDGQVTGVKLYGIRRAGILAKLGLQNGDLLRTINGLTLTTPDEALDVYAKLRNARHLSLALTRRDRPVNLAYTIEP